MTEPVTAAEALRRGITRLADAGLADAMAAGVKVTFGSRDAVEAAGSLFDRVETL